MILFFINDTEENLRGILDMCAEAEVKGIICFGMGLTLREGNREYFYQQLDRNFPGLKEIYRNKYGDQYMVTSPRDRYLMGIFRKFCTERGILYDPDTVFAYLNEFEEKQETEQLSLW